MSKLSVVMFPSGRVAQIIRPEVEQNMLPHVNRVVQAAKVLAPKDTGRLARSIRLRARTSSGTFTKVSGTNIKRWEIVVAVSYGHVVSVGSAPHIIRSKGPWPLRNTKTGKVFGRVVKHPGTKPNDYLEKALLQGFTVWGGH